MAPKYRYCILVPARELEGLRMRQSANKVILARSIKEIGEYKVAIPNIDITVYAIIFAVLARCGNSRVVNFAI